MDGKTVAQKKVFTWFGILCLSGIFLMGQTTQGLAAECVDFEDPPVSPPNYHVADSFTDSGSQVTGIDFQWDSGVWTSIGVAEIVVAGGFWCDAGGSGQELLIDNINLRIDFPEVLTEGLTVRFAEHGGNVNIGINGVHQNAPNFDVLHTTTVGGVLVTCTGPGCAGAGVGELRLEGSINEFYIGGQEFCVDDVCPISPSSSCAASAEASTYGVGPVYGSSDLARHLAFLFLPVGAVVGLRIWRRKK